MNSQEPKNGPIQSQGLEGLESPFLEEEFFVGEPEAEWEPRLTRLEAESPFQRAFEQGRISLIEPKELEKEFVEEDVRPYIEPEGKEDVYPLEEAAYAEEEEEEEEDVYPLKEAAYAEEEEEEEEGVSPLEEAAYAKEEEEEEEEEEEGEEEDIYPLEEAAYLEEGEGGKKSKSPTH